MTNLISCHKLFTNHVRILPVLQMSVKEDISFPNVIHLTVHCVCSGDGPIPVSLAK